MALAVCLMLRVALAQAPGGVRPAEDVDPRGYKILVPFNFLSVSKNAVEANSKLVALKGQIRSILNQTSGLGDNRGRFENYFIRYYFPMMTQTSDEALKGLPEERQRFLRDAELCKSPETHSVLIGLTLAEMQRIVTDTFHPAVRYNAMLIISGLNDVEALRVHPYATPEPMARALPIILTEFKRANNSDAIKLAALLGLSRHLEWEPFRNENSPNGAIQPDLKREIMAELTALAQLKDPPAGRDGAGHVWFRRRAIEALGLSCAAKPDPAVAATLDALLRDEQEPLSLRLTVATTLGRMSLQPPAAIDAKAAAVEMGYLALVACDTELRRVIDLRKTEDERFIRLQGQLPGEGLDTGFAGPRAALGSPDGGPGPGYGGPGGYGAPGAGLRPQMPLPGGSPDGGFGEAGAFGEGGFGDPSMDPSLMDPKHYRFEFVRKRLRHQLSNIQIGLLGGQDYVPPKAGSTPALPPLVKTAAAAAKTGDAAPPPPLSASYGMRATAKAADKAAIEDIYSKVRMLADIIENRSTSIEQLDRDLRRYMKPLEAVTRKLAPPPIPAAPGPAADEDDLFKPPAAAVPAAAAPPAAAPPAAAPMPPAAAAPMPPAATAPMPPAGKAP